MKKGMAFATRYDESATAAVIAPHLIRCFSSKPQNVILCPTTLSTEEQNAWLLIA